MQPRYATKDCLECLGVAAESDEATLATVHPSPQQARDLTNLASKICARAHGLLGLEEDVLTFNILAGPRILIFEGDIMKKATDHLIKRTTRRHLLLFNDCLLVCSVKKAGGSLRAVAGAENYYIHNIVSVGEMVILDPPRAPEDEHTSFIFEILSSHRSLVFEAETRSDKTRWLTELAMCAKAMRAGTLAATVPGWEHEVVQGTIYSAALLGNTEWLRIRIQQVGSSAIGTPDEKGVSALHYAALRGHDEAVQLLLDHGAQVDVLNNALCTPLHFAATNAHTSTMRLLINSGADSSLRNMKDRDSLFMTVLYAGGCEDLQSALDMLKSEGVDLNSVDSSGSAPLHACAELGLQHSATSLVEAGANVNVRHAITGWTPLHTACHIKPPDFETIRTLLEAGAYPNIPTPNKQTAFDILFSEHSLPSLTPAPPAQRTLRKQAPTAPRTPLTPAEEELMNTWMVNVLPAVMELVRKGARFDPRELSIYNEVIQLSATQAAQHWQSLTEPEQFTELVTDLVTKLSRSNWVPDSASEVCLLCAERWSVTNRRHHCRICGVLVCHDCSSKQLVVDQSSSSREQRACDGCFNRCTAVAKTRRQQFVAIRKAVSMRQESAAAESPSSAQRSAQTAASTMAEAMNNLQRRGEILDEISDKAAGLEAAAAEFKKNTKELLKQHEQQSKKMW